MPKKPLPKSRKINNQYPTKKLYRFSIFWLALILGILCTSYIIFGIISTEKHRKQDQIEKQVYINLRNDFNKVIMSFHDINPSVRWELNTQGSCEWVSGIGMKPGHWACSLFAAGEYPRDSTFNQKKYIQRLLKVMKMKYGNQFIFNNQPSDKTETLYVYAQSIYCRLSSGSASQDSDIYFSCGSTDPFPSKSWYKNTDFNGSLEGTNAWKEESNDV